MQTIVSPVRHDRTISFAVGLPRLVAHPPQINSVNEAAADILSDARRMSRPLANRPAQASVVFGVRIVDSTTSSGANQRFPDTTVLYRLINARATGA